MFSVMCTWVCLWRGKEGGVTNEGVCVLFLPYGKCDDRLKIIMWKFYVVSHTSRTGKIHQLVTPMKAFLCHAKY